jgi:hypothetical protein
MHSECKVQLTLLHENTLLQQPQQGTRVLVTTQAAEFFPNWPQIVAFFWVSDRQFLTLFFLFLCVLNQSPRLKHQVSVSSQKRKGFNK